MDIQMDVPGEREPPLYFAGRQDELDALGSKLHRLCATGDPSGGLQLTVGVLGIGKTQLAMEFAKPCLSNCSTREIFLGAVRMANADNQPNQPSGPGDPWSA